MSRASRDRLRQRRVFAILNRDLAGRVICEQCGATLATYGDRCSADLAARCQGFEAIEFAIRVAAAEIDAPAPASGTRH